MAGAPRWLRLTRSGDTIIGYDSADGTHWSALGTVTLPGLPTTVPAGPFAASPDYSAMTSQSLGAGSSVGGPSQATAAFDHVTMAGASGTGAWTGTAVGGSAGGPYPVLGYHQSGSGVTVSGSGDIAPVAGSGASSVANTQIGTFAGLIAMSVVATMFITAEYRRGLIRVTLTASPRRHQILAAKAIVIGVAAFVVGVPAAVAALLINEPLAPWAGFAVLCAWVALTLGLATYLLRRRDA